MKHIETLPIVLFGISLILAIVVAIFLVKMRRDDITQIKDDADYQNAERPFIDNNL